MTFPASSRKNLCGSLAALAAILITVHSCGPKDSVEDNETEPDQSKVEPRSRLTGGSGNSTGVVSYCRLPLDLATVVDPRRAGQTQTVLTSKIDSRCANYPEVRITLKTKQRITLVGKYFCRNGSTLNEQICTGISQDILSQQKNAVSIAVSGDTDLRPADLEASIDFM
jgi:hypothetical protein